MDPIRGATLKVLRAQDHFEEFRSGVRDLKTQWPGFEIVERDPRPDAVVGSGQLISAFPLSDVLSLCLGDFVQDMRAALDYIAWQARPKDTTYFPVCLSETGRPGSFEWYFDREGKRRGGRGARIVDDMPGSIAEVIRSLQPYRRGRRGVDCPLSLLHELARRERHRLLLLTSGKVWTNKTNRGDNLITVALQEAGPAKGANVFATCASIVQDMTEVVIPAFREAWPRG
jgi:hypothetical protein